MVLKCSKSVYINGAKNAFMYALGFRANSFTAIDDDVTIWKRFPPYCTLLTHWGRVTHICVSKLTIIGSDNGLSPGRHQAIIWTNAAILSIRPLGTNFSEILIEIPIFSFKKSNLKMSVRNLAAILSWPQCVNERIPLVTAWPSSQRPSSTNM